MIDSINAAYITPYYAPAAPTATRVEPANDAKKEKATNAASHIKDIKISKALYQHNTQLLETSLEVFSEALDPSAAEEKNVDSIFDVLSQTYETQNYATNAYLVAQNLGKKAA